MIFRGALKLMTLSGINQNVTAWRKMLSSTVTIVMPRRRSPAARQSGVTVSSQQLSLGTFQEVVFLRFTFKNHPTKSKHLTFDFTADSRGSLGSC